MSNPCFQHLSEKLNSILSNNIKIDFKLVKTIKATINKPRTEQSKTAEVTLLTKYTVTTALPHIPVKHPNI